MVRYRSMNTDSWCIMIVMDLMAPDFDRIDISIFMYSLIWVILFVVCTTLMVKCIWRNT